MTTGNNQNTTTILLALAAACGVAGCSGLVLAGGFAYYMLNMRPEKVETVVITAETNTEPINPIRQEPADPPKVISTPEAQGRSPQPSVSPTAVPVVAPPPPVVAPPPPVVAPFLPVAAPQIGPTPAVEVQAVTVPATQARDQLDALDDVVAVADLASGSEAPADTLPVEDATEEPLGEEALRANAEEQELEQTCPLERSFEMKAMVGKLDDEIVACYESRYVLASHMTTRDKLSRVLIANAFGKGDLKDWEALVARHLKEVNQADPDMCFKYASHIYKRAPARASEIIYWSNRALENRHIWTGGAHVERVYGLHKMRSNAALNNWEKAGKNFALNPSTQGQRAEENARISTKTYAREWIDYSIESRKDPNPAFGLCLSASGDKAFCRLN